MPKRFSARALAAQVLAQVFTRRQTLTATLPEYLSHLDNNQDRALAQEICYGVMRWYHRLQHLVELLTNKDLKAKDMDIKTLILAGLYQLMFLRIPPHAAVSATVDACIELRKPWAKGLINAILRRYQRESDHLLIELDKMPGSRYAHPDWLLALLQQDYPAGWESIVIANNAHPPMTLRINQRKTTRERYLALLQNARIGAMPAPYANTAIQLEHAVDVSVLPGFAEGLVSVQDSAAQLTPALLDLQPGQRVLDACAAPGGKLAHILETAPDLVATVAVETDPRRLLRTRETLARLGLEARLLQGDARHPENWWDGKSFDRILLDAPCTATGVIRRHPDIKFLRIPDDLDTVTRLQAELLAALWPLLKTGGKLLYVTCSVLNSENDRQVGEFTTHHHDTRSILIDSEWGTATAHGRQLLPGENAMDGFYYASLEKL